MNEQSISGRAKVLDVLRRHKEEFEERFGITELGVFGSVAKDAAKEESDVDVVITMRKPGLFYMVHIKEALEKALDRPVDIIHYRERMNELLKNRIHEEAIYV